MNHPIIPSCYSLLYSKRR